MDKFKISRVKSFINNHYSIRNKLRANIVLKRLNSTPPNWETLILNRISQGDALLFGRLGGVEASCLGIFRDLNSGLRKPIRYAQARLLYKKRLAQLCNNAGVYPARKDSFDFFCEEHLKALDLVDIFSVWAKPSAWIEADYMNDSLKLIVSGDASYPWLESRDGVSTSGWATAFSGKKILVVSPFIDSISNQVPNLEKIFQGILVPNMSFIYLLAPLTQGGASDGKTYEIHLSELKKEMDGLEFDIALVSAGSYSLPLAAHAKRMGKVGIHGGGATQIFFGITGQRYDTYSQVTRFFNEHWTRPKESERPANWREIEDGCYW